MRHLFIASLPIVLLSIAACGGNVVTTAGSGASGGSGGSGTGGAGASGGSGGSLVCPPEIINGPCDAPGTRCTYGESVRPECRSEMVCENGMWSNEIAICSETTTCPDVMPQTGGDCSFEGDVCVYDTTICECNACIGGPCMQFPKWGCQGPPAGAGCPEIIPNEGTACSQSGIECIYGNPCGISGGVAQCVDGVWHWQEAIPCPA